MRLQRCGMVAGVLLFAIPVFAQFQCQWASRVQQAMIQSLQGVPEESCKVLALPPDDFNRQHRQIEQKYLLSKTRLIETPIRQKLQAYADKYTKPGAETVLVENNLVPSAFATGQYVVFTSGIIEWYMNPDLYLRRLGMGYFQANQYLAQLPARSPGQEGLLAILGHETSHNLLGHPDVFPLTDLCSKYVSASVSAIKRYQQTGKQSGGVKAFLMNSLTGFLGTFQASQEQQQHEAQADRLGAWLVFRATGDRQAMAKSLQWLSLAPLHMIPSSRGEAVQEALCSNHPDLVARINEAQQLGFLLSPAQPPDGLLRPPIKPVVQRYQRFLSWREQQLGESASRSAQSGSAEQTSPAASYKLNWESEPGLDTPDPNKVYSSGEKLKIDEPHGVYTGLLEMDAVYFVRIDEAEIESMNRSAAHDCETNPYECSTGLIEAQVRHATSSLWKNMTFRYSCELRELKSGQVEVARPGFKSSDLLIGSHDSVCDLKSSSSLP